MPELDEVQIHTSGSGSCSNKLTPNEDGELKEMCKKPLQKSGVDKCMFGGILGWPMEHVGISSRFPKDERKHWSLLCFVSWDLGFAFGRLGVWLRYSSREGIMGLEEHSGPCHFALCHVFARYPFLLPGSESDCTVPASPTKPCHSPRYSPAPNLLPP